MDEGKAQAVLDAARHSMGMDVRTRSSACLALPCAADARRRGDHVRLACGRWTLNRRAVRRDRVACLCTNGVITQIKDVDLKNVHMFAERIIKLAEYRLVLQEYLRSKMELVAPNLQSLIGDQVAARLISHAGSLTSLAKYPASTVQILGAEKALFRALKTRGNTPKYGLIFHSTFISRAAAKNKGRISRYLANKCSIAARIDSFSELPTSKYGEKLREQVEERLRFYDSGDAPRKNVDVMKEARAEVLEELSNRGSGNDGAVSAAAPSRSEGEVNARKKRKKEKEKDDTPRKKATDGDQGNEKTKKKKAKTAQ
jgi:hypothetical protein